ncbi:MAG: hypothetical protein LC754_12085 [Acidobacteria bacterium]|nr:hypothetical protein [Acidobacteriota bacterium]
MRGISDVSVEQENQPITLLVRFHARAINAQRIGRTAKRALETDPNNHAPVRVAYERE